MGIDTDLCVFAARRTWLVAVDALTGAERWSSKIRTTYGTIAFTASNVVYQNGHREVLAFDRTTGEQVWSHQFADICGWLHAYDDTVVIGGWRGYSNIFGLDGSDGRVLWEHPARASGVHATKLHADSSAVAVASSGGEILFLDLRTGAELDAIHVPEGWDQQAERLEAYTRPGHPLIFDGGSNHFVCIEGAGRRLSRIDVPSGIWSRNLTAHDGCVPFISEDGDLIVWLQLERRLVTLGRAQRTRAWDLPFSRVDEDLFAAHTGDGPLSLYSTRDALPVATKEVSKGIRTGIGFADGVLTYGTGSGDAIALRLDASIP